MKIAFLTEFPIVPYLGGIERVSAILSENFIKKGHEVIFISIKDEAYFKGTQNFSAHQRFLPAQTERRQQKFAEIIEEEKPDVIINQHFIEEGAELLGRIKSFKIKKISVYHNKPFSFYGRERLLKKLTYPVGVKGRIMKLIGLSFPLLYRKARMKSFKKLMARIYENSDRVFLLSQRFIPRMNELMPELNISKFDAINNPNSFDVKSVSSPKENLVIFVGRMEDPQKNVRAFIDTWNIFHKNHPDWHALIIGDGPHKTLFEKYAEKTKTENLTFTGNVKNIEDYYSRAKMLCVTSTYEGWGMVLTEAMAYGTVPLAFDTYESLHDIIVNGETGVIIDDISPSKMADSMSMLAENETLREKIASKAKTHIENFKAEEIADLWIAKLSQI